MQLSPCESQLTRESGPGLKIISASTCEIVAVESAIKAVSFGKVKMSPGAIINGCAREMRASPKSIKIGGDSVN